MAKSFYHFLMRFRNGNDELSKFAEGAFGTLVFRKNRMIMMN